MHTMTASTTIKLPDYDAIKARQQVTWASGDYSRIGVTLQITGELLCEAMDLHAGQTVLDVAGGNGNASLAAARRFCKVVSTDYVPALLEQSGRRAAAEGLVIDYQEADVENLPFATGTFDNVVSTFGVMFAPNQSRAASELLRVCKPGGKIGLANWTPDGFIGQLFKLIGRYLPPPVGINSPSAWGTREFLDLHFGAHASGLRTTRNQFVFRYNSPAHWLEVFSRFYGPMLKAFEALDQEARESLQHGIIALIAEYNLASNGAMVVPSDYLEVVVVR